MRAKGNAAWEALRAKVAARSGGVCERCEVRRAVHVHHLVYGGRRRGEEPLHWLQHVCLQCHSHYHPKHTFRTVAQQKAIAARRKRESVRLQKPVCAHCGNTWSRAKHNAICVKYELTGQPRLPASSKTKTPKPRPKISRSVGPLNRMSAEEARDWSELSLLKEKARKSDT